MLLFVLCCHTQINNVLSPFVPFLHILIQEEKHELYSDKEMNTQIHFFLSC